MNDPHVIQANFRVPKGCRHSWLLFHNDEWIGVIEGRPGKKQIEHYFREPTKPHDHALIMSRNLDWIQESVEHLRWICEQ